MEKIIRFPLPRGEQKSIEIPKNRVVQNSGNLITVHNLLVRHYIFFLNNKISFASNIEITDISGGPLLSSRLYAPQQKASFLDFSADENGLWTIMGTKYVTFIT